MTAGSPTSVRSTTSGSTSIPTSSPASSRCSKEWGTHPSWTRAVASPAPVRRRSKRELARTRRCARSDGVPHDHLAAPRRAAVARRQRRHHPRRRRITQVDARGGRAGRRPWREDRVGATQRRRRSRAAAAAMRPARPAHHHRQRCVFHAGHAARHRRLRTSSLGGTTRRCTSTTRTASACWASDPERRACRTAHGGGGVVRYFGLGYDNIVYVAGLSKAFSSLGAFVTCRSPEERSLFLTASTMIFSGSDPGRELGDRARRVAGESRARVTSCAGMSIASRCASSTARDDAGSSSRTRSASPRSPS